MSASTLQMPQSLINQCRSLICLPETRNSKVLARSSIAPASLGPSSNYQYSINTNVSHGIFVATILTTSFPIANNVFVACFCWKYERRHISPPPEHKTWHVSHQWAFDKLACLLTTFIMAWVTDGKSCIDPSMKTGIIVAWKSSLQSTFGQTEYYMRRVKAKLAKAAVNTSQLILMKIKHCEHCEQCFTFIFYFWSDIKL